MQTISPARQEARQLALLIGPILVTQLSQAAYGFIDTVMAGQVSPLDLAAVAIGSSIWLPLILLVSGILMATTPLVAEAWGARRLHDIPATVHQALWLAVFIGILGFFLLRHISPLFALLDVPPRLHDMTQRYLLGISWGLPAVALFAVLRCYCEGLGRPLPIMVISVLGLLINTFLNYVLIYGHFGAPALGGPGCGWATGITMWCTLAMLLAYVLLSPYFHNVRLLHEKSAPHWQAIRNFLALGIPIGVAIFFEVSVFCVIAVLISPLGEQIVAGHQIALSVTSLTFMVPLSLAICMTIRIGHAYGRRDVDAISLTRRVGLRAMVLIGIISASCIILGRHGITAIYTQDPAVRALAATLLLYAGTYQLFDALQVGAAGALRGLQDTRSPMLITLLAYWVAALPLGYTLGLTLLLGDKLGPQGFWTGLVVGLLIACVLLNWRLRNRVRELRREWDGEAKTRSEA